jgi:hypothetical protein
MCVKWKDDWQIAADDFSVYKIVSVEEGRYISPLPLDKRASQAPSGNVGAVLEYALGATMHSDHPGIYCLEEPMGVGGAQTILELRVPKGATFRRGKCILQDTAGNEYECHTVNALHVEVIREVPPDECVAAKPSSKVGRGYAIDIPTWAYTTTAVTSTTTATFIYSNTTNDITWNTSATDNFDTTTWTTT